VAADDLTRVLQGLITGIGFLGSGAILKKSNAEEITGLTTAASIWLTAAIGVAVGMGREASAILSTILAWLILSVLPWIGHRNGPDNKHESLPAAGSGDTDPPRDTQRPDRSPPRDNAANLDPRQ
jgi:putative Mg2+ transporter-C (MgtC) family protein